MAVEPLPYTFSSHGHKYEFNQTRIFHCIENDRKYIASLFTYNGYKGNFIKFCQRRVKNGWGGYIGKPKITQMMPCLYFTFTDSHDFPSKKFRNSTFDIQSDTYKNEYQKLLGEHLHKAILGMHKMSYEEEIVDVRREIIWLSLSQMATMHGVYKKNSTNLTPEELYDVIKEYDFLNGIEPKYKESWPEVIEQPEDEVQKYLEAEIKTESVKCLDDEGYEGVLVRGESYQVISRDEEMIEIITKDGLAIRLFNDRFE